MSKEFDCNYGESEFNIIKAGIESIEAVLTGNCQLGIFEDKGTWNCGMLITEISKRFRG